MCSHLTWKTAKVNVYIAWHVLWKSSPKKAPVTCGRTKPFKGKQTKQVAVLLRDTRVHVPPFTWAVQKQKIIKNKQILNCELGKYCDSDEMGIIFRKKKRNIKQSIIKTVTARKKKKQFRGQQQREKFNSERIGWHYKLAGLDLDARRVAKRSELQGLKIPSLRPRLLLHKSNFVMNKRGKFLKKLWCSVGARV